MADFYVNALERLNGVSGQEGLEGVHGLENLGAASDRLNGVRPGAGVDSADDVSFASSYNPSARGVNGQMADVWEAIRRGNTTYYFSSNTDAQGRYEAAAQAKADEVVASFSGDVEDVREIRNRLLRGESLDSVLTDVRGKRNDLNVAAAVAKNNSSAQASANNDIVDPYIHESSSVAYAKDGSSATASSGKESAANATATEHSIAGASSDQNSGATSTARQGSFAVSSAFEQSQAKAKATDGSEATVSADNGGTASAEADHNGVSRSEARNDAMATSKARAGEAHAEATDGSSAQAQSKQKDHYEDFKVGKDGVNTVWGALRKAGWSDEEIVKQNLVEKAAHDNKLKDAGVVMAGQKLHIEHKPEHKPEAEAIGANRSAAEAEAHGKDSHAGVLADDGTSGRVETGAHQTQDIKVSPPRTGSLPPPDETFV